MIYVCYFCLDFQLQVMQERQLESGIYVGEPAPLRALAEKIKTVATINDFSLSTACLFYYYFLFESYARCLMRVERYCSRMATEALENVCLIS